MKKRLIRRASREIDNIEYEKMLEVINQCGMYHTEESEAKLESLMNKLSGKDQSDIYVKSLWDKIAHMKNIQEYDCKKNYSNFFYIHETVLNHNLDEANLTLGEDDINLNENDLIQKINKIKRKFYNNKQEYLNIINAFFSKALIHTQFSSYILNRYAKDFTKENWSTLCRYQKLEEDFIQKHVNNIDLDSLLFNDKIDMTNRLETSFEFNADTSQVLLKKISDWKNKKESSNPQFVKYTELIIKKICKNVDLSEQVIEQYANILNWDAVSQFQKLSDSFIREHQDKINFRFLFSNQKADISKIILDPNFLDKLGGPDKQLLYVISAFKTVPLTEKSMLEKIEKTQKELSQYKPNSKKVNQNPHLDARWVIPSYINGLFANPTPLSEQTIIDFINNNNMNDERWKSLFKKQELSDSFIQQYVPKEQYAHLVSGKQLTPQTLDKVFVLCIEEKEVMENLFKNQKVPEKLIEAHASELDSYWDLISLYQPLGYNFVLGKYSKKLNIKNLKLNENIDQEKFEKFKVYDFLET